jgi:hypothetical protein
VKRRLVCAAEQQQLRSRFAMFPSDALVQVSASELNVSTRCSSSSRVEFAAHTHRGGIGEWIKLHAAEMSDSSTQVVHSNCFHSHSVVIALKFRVIDELLTLHAADDVCYKYWHGSW